MVKIQSKSTKIRTLVRNWNLVSFCFVFVFDWPVPLWNSLSWKRLTFSTVRLPLGLLQEIKIKEFSKAHKWLCIHENLTKSGLHSICSSRERCSRPCFCCYQRLPWTHFLWVKFFFANVRGIHWEIHNLETCAFLVCHALHPSPFTSTMQTVHSLSFRVVNTYVYERRRNARQASWRCCRKPCWQSGRNPRHCESVKKSKEICTNLFSPDLISSLQNVVSIPSLLQTNGQTSPSLFALSWILRFKSLVFPLQRDHLPDWTPARTR